MFKKKIKPYRKVYDEYGEHDDYACMVYGKLLNKYGYKWNTADLSYISRKYFVDDDDVFIHYDCYDNFKHLR